MSLITDIMILALRSINKDSLLKYNKLKVAKINLDITKPNIRKNGLRHRYLAHRSFNKVQRLTDKKDRFDNISDVEI